MLKEHLARIDVNDFIQGDITFKAPVKQKSLGTSALIYVTKSDNGLIISPPYNEDTAYIKDFSIVLIPLKENEEEPKFVNNKFICNFNWTPKKNNLKYCLYKNNILIKQHCNTNTKYDFSKEDNGTYVFRVEVLEQNNFIQDSAVINQYIYPYLNIPIFSNYKYFFYYYIENKEKDIFSKDLLTVLPIDVKGADIIKNNKNDLIEINQCCFKESSFAPIENKGVLINDKYIYFSENTYSQLNLPPSYFILKLLKTPGSQYGLLPDIKYIDIYIEEILENDETINSDFEGGVD